MLTCVRIPWTSILGTYLLICMFTYNGIFAASMRGIYVLDPKNEPGFDLNQEDITKFHIWPTGVLPYYIDDFSFDKVLRDRLRIFLNGVNRLTPLSFVEIPKPPEDDKTRWVLFLNRKGLLGCADHPFERFTNEGVQKVVLGYHCMNSDENLADIVLSLVGVPPQHNAPDRNEYVVIIEENILPDKLYLFEQLENSEWLFHILKYDIESAGHYGPYKHTANGKITVERASTVDIIPSIRPKQMGFSSLDVLKIAMLYNFILRNRKASVPECSRLFEAGNKSISFQENLNIKFKPRQKPSLYLSKSGNELVPEDNGNGEINDVEKLMDNTENYENKELKHETEEDISYNDQKVNKNYDQNDEIKYVEEDSPEHNNNKESNNENNNNNIIDNESENDNINAFESIKDEKKQVAENYMSDNNNNENNYSKEEIEKGKNSNTENKKKSNDISDQKGEANQNNKISENVTTYEGTVNTTRQNHLKPLSHKINNSNKHRLLGQSDYETGDEGGNKYVHERDM